MNQPLTLQIEHLNQFYGARQVLFDIDLHIQQGMFGLLGRNGAGKTTLMKTLVTLLPVRKGEVRIDGVLIKQVNKIREMVGYLPQEFTMYGSMTVKGAMEYLALLSELPHATIKRRVPELLDKVNLVEHQHKKVKALSGGMKRRLGIAQALLHDPKLLIVDEPTAGLDPEERVRFRNLLSELAEERIVILSTHIVGDIEATCEHIAIMHEGRLLFTGTVQQLLQAAAGKVYTVTVSRDQVQLWKQGYTVTGMMMQGNSCELRLLSDAPINEAASIVEPNIEDAYMWQLGLHQGG
ncbi:ABC transporter ATP-binding protein [Paenibacillus montaniterrae]|uniref:ABC transporter ATP-binding protein n=1 Tax=Paenibacillus montaniterrae TaxID=429341 RepID=A0A919YPA1_9BACL|nr:ABC transporter ATP-binding protein [Paenibacillus montaniterrae]GIP17548.1 ABC transporter ATP-binding protein [Paenibacillus montaniterrae]